MLISAQVSEPIYTFTLNVHVFKEHGKIFNYI